MKTKLLFWRTFALGMTLAFGIVVALSQPYYTPLDTTTNTINGCSVIHSWAYTNTGYQVPVLQGVGMSGVMKDFVFIGRETTNSPQIDPVVYLIGLTDFEAIRTTGVMLWQQNPYYYGIFTLGNGLKMERLTSVNDGCGIDSTNFVRFTSNQTESQEGISVRAYIATAVLQGLLMHGSAAIGKDGFTDHPQTAACAIRYADALIAELNK